MIQKEEQLEWLHQHQTKEPHLGLERVRRLLALRGNPHLQISVIHIAGTNGKGSTIAHLRQLLQAKRLCIGTFTSPYLLNYNEQIAINGLLISDEDFCSLLQSYQRLLKEQADDTILQEITEFEIITALAYDYFCQQEVDVVIMEVGLGGLLDSTNVCQPDLTAITTIGLDHMAILGTTLADIAVQKAGIIKERVPVVTGKISSEALAVIHTIAQQRQASHVCYGKDYQVESVQGLEEGEDFLFSNAFRQKEDYQTVLLGIHQVENAGLAIELCDQYCSVKGLPLLSENEVRRALKRTYWPARLEKITNAPLILLDGAHNPHAMKALIASLESYFPDYQKHILFSCIQTKALDEMVALLKTVSKSQLFLTTFEDSRSFSTEEMQGLAKREKLAYVEWLPYLEQYKKVKHGEKELLLITGSLYFLANVRKYLISD
ncbi:bifunctional folylpolyglutamate synthase/dihydrofolate synthase [Streptococcus anginosus]|uniref:bifunctional folylpolyglutamate synthase/dihydrofolate synthase n=1 Tax=Streptococcus anginosus TaxID=1328 RepID=UPI0003549F5F|nr:folylpolyglutamate synthase/dihydrofolate synthase family protein [Streptococcus anginosus]MDB8660462.1 bifunctional folylpolyglutamate synthase/dihydrofolate synthase [Streptococcus anginosus]BAN62487.1 coenzyme metabolism [Streptococcus anginosus subsp. whileyi MAS624]